MILDRCFIQIIIRHGNKRELVLESIEYPRAHLLHHPNLRALCQLWHLPVEQVRWLLHRQSVFALLLGQTGTLLKDREPAEYIPSWTLWVQEGQGLSMFHWGNSFWYCYLFLGVPCMESLWCHSNQKENGA